MTSSRQDGQFIRTKKGWSIRFYDHSGRRVQRGTFPTKTEARTILDEELRKVRMGGSYRPKLTLNQLVVLYMDQYDAAPSTRENLAYFLGFAQKAFGDELVSQVDPHRVAAWRSKLATDHQKEHATRALRQVLSAALRWGWIERNPAAGIRNEASRPADFKPFDSWADVLAIAAEMDPEWPTVKPKQRHYCSSATLVITAAGTGLRPEELFALERSSIDLDTRTVLVKRAYAKGVMKEYTKTTGSRRSVPLRGVVVDSLERYLSAFEPSGLVFEAERGGPINIDNWRSREWVPALETAGITPRRRIYDLRHTYATWSLAAGVNVFQLARRMGTSVSQVSATYGHLLADADQAERELLDKYDSEGEP